MAQLVTQFVTGAQNNSAGKSVGESGYLQAGTCCKHFAGAHMLSSACLTRALSLPLQPCLLTPAVMAVTGAAYDLENAPTSRQSFNAELTSRDMWETYMPAFKACITEGRSSHVMCSCACDSQSCVLYDALMMRRARN
jgi:hypothetical protein